jgi:CarD family transcriptional regulator
MAKNSKKMIKKTVKKPATKVTNKKPAPKTPQKTARKIVKPIAKKTVAKKPVAKKIVAKKAIVKKALAKKTAPVKSAAKSIAVKPAEKKPMARMMAKPVARKEPQKPAPLIATIKEQKVLYKVGNFVVYPTHGVGKIMAEETQMIGDIELRLLVINFERDKMTLRVPMQRAAAAGLRPISSADKMKEVYGSLKSKAKISRGMWSRRAQEYETKINSGNIILISEVVRDLHQNVDQSERSYSERMIYENALNRLVGEVAAAERTDTKTAYDKLMKLLRAKVAAAALKEAA